MVGSFAMMTMMVKNNLMDHLAADYVRTAVAKGVSFRRAVFGHALRNSLIPIATTIGGVVGIFVGGSMLIEKIFDIDGFGLLQFSALVERDETIIMGTLTISAFLLLVGNIISDFAVAMVDPKISFD
jgi:microcin C transport system permease protein